MNDTQRLSPEFPEEVILEVTNLCNLRCRHCHFHGDTAQRRRPLGSMDPSVWRSVLDDMAHWPRPVTLLTHGAGEPLLYPFLGDLLAAAKSLPHLRVGFMTNGMLLDATWTERLLDLRVDFLALSIDGVDPRTHDAVRRNARLELIEYNVRHLIKRKDERGSTSPALYFNMVLYPHIVRQGEDFVAHWISVADAVTLSTFRPIGERTLWRPHEAPPFRPCPLLWRQCVVAWDGRLGLCCEDIHLEVPAGSVRDEPLLHLFRTSPILGLYRRHHVEHALDNLPLCNGCHVWGAETVLEVAREDIAGFSVMTTRTPAYRLYRKETPSP